MTNAYQSYEKVRQSIAKGANPRRIPELDRFIPDYNGKTNEELMQILLGTVFDPDVLYDFLDGKFKSLVETTANQGTKRTGQLSWGAGFNGRAAQMAYERTGQTRFIELYIKFFNEMLAFRDDALGLYDHYHDRIMTSWGVDGESVTTNAGYGIWCSHVTHYSVLMEPATGIARLIHERPELSAYKDFADRIVADFNQGYREFDMDIRHIPGTEEIWYWRPTKFQYEATNHLHLQGEALLNMYAITKDQVYADRIASLLRTFEKSARIDNKGFAAWDYHPYFAQSGSANNRRQKSEFIWKASFTVPFVYAANQQGFPVDRTLIDAMTKTIRDHVLANNDYAGNLHPRGSKPFLQRLRNPVSAEGSKALSIVGFLAASVEDPSITDQLRTIVATRRDIFPSGWLRPAERKPSVKGPLGYAFMMKPS
ncbi:MAG: hypothetical protein KDK53_17020 [Maritimibacter sp.]|nr:hypothetical protein [Maritimibacter sp.]